MTKEKEIDLRVKVTNDAFKVLERVHEILKIACPNTEEKPPDIGAFYAKMARSIDAAGE